MKFRIDLPEIGCYCERAVDSRLYMYCFHILSERCTSEITVPSEVDGIPITEVMVEYERNPVSTVLKKLIIPSGVCRIEIFSSFFSKYPNVDLLEIVIDKDNPHFRVYDGVLYRHRLLLCALDRRKESYDILPRTRRICCSAFAGCKMSRVTMPPSVRIISRNAFQNCDNLRYINFDNVKTIESSAFQGCPLAETAFPASLRTIEAFAFWRVFEHIVIPKTVKKIFGYAFDGCGKIEVFDEIKYDTLIMNGDNFELSVRSSESGELLYKIFYPHDSDFQYKLEIEFKRTGEFDFDMYDGYFNMLRDEISYGSADYEEKCFAMKLPVCINRLMYPHMLSESAKRTYLEFLSDNKTRGVKYVIDESDIERLRFCIEMKLIDADNFAELLDYSVYRNRTEFTALLLDYKNRNLPELPFALELE